MVLISEQVKTRRFFNEVKIYVQEQGRTHMGISFRDTATSFTTRFWGTYWQERLSCALTGTSMLEWAQSQSWRLGVTAGQLAA